MPASGPPPNPRKLLLISLLLLSLSLSTRQTCNEGCLKCKTSADDCQVCDSLKLYYLSAHTCVRVLIDNCYRVGFEGECLQCITGYYYDASKHNCLEVPRAFLLENCVTYSRYNICSKCNTDAYLTSDGNCLPVASKIGHCNEYARDSPLQCVQCFKDYVLSKDGSECLSVAETHTSSVMARCSSYARFSCDECATGYSLSPSAYSELEPAVQDPDFSSFLWNAHFSFSDRKIVFATCAKPRNANCSVFDDYTLDCTRCHTGHYFSKFSEQCESNPATVIPSCRVYSTAVLCAECNATFHLVADQSQCEVDVAIENCELHDGAAVGATKCAKCVPDYHLNGDMTQCVARVYVDGLQCKQLQLNSNECLLCQPGLRRTDDGLKCLVEIPKCQAYKASTQADLSHDCTECSNGYLYRADDKSCFAPGNSERVDNCMKYTHDDTTCQVCSEGYYYDSVNNLCLEHRLMPGCQETDGATAHKCKTCSIGYALFLNLNQCVAAWPIPNCVIHKNSNNCEECQEGFFGDNCGVISLGLHCLRLDTTGGNCLKCFPGYYLVAGECQASEEHEARYCMEMGVHSCKKCKPQSLLTGVQNFSICRPRATLAGSISTNCQRYDGLLKRCVKCNEGFYLDGIVCLKYCPSQRSSVVVRRYALNDKTLYLSAENECLDGQSLLNPFCQFFVPDSLDPSKLLCAVCKGGSVPVVNFEGTGHHMFSFSDDSGPVFVTNEGLALPGLQCLKDINFDTVVNCEYWFQVGAYLKCAKCKYGFKGLVDVFQSQPFVKKCVRDFECSRAKIPFGSGLDMNWKLQTRFPKNILSSFLSCYHCKNTNQIPLLFLKKTADKFEMSNYKLDDPTSNFYGTLKHEDVDADYVHRCINPFTYSFKNTQVDSYFPQNCGIGAVDVAQPAVSNTNHDFVQCLICGAMYRAVFSDDLITKCETIANCETSWQFGRCSICKLGYVWSYEKDDAFVDKTTCIQFPDRQCISGYIDGTDSRPKCKICKTGFSPNIDGLCEKFMPSFCRLGFATDVPQVTKTSHIFSLRDFLSFSPPTQGCHNCETSGQVSVFSPEKRMICLPSYYVQWNAFPTGSKLIANCDSYEFDLTGTLEADFAPHRSETKCAKCLDGYIVSTDGKSCVQMTIALAHCLEVDSSTSQCQLCETHYFPQTGACQPNTINFCLTAAFDGGSSKQICQLCDKGYYYDSAVSETACLPGMQPHCDVYGVGNNDCQKCALGYWPLPLQDGKRKCMQIEHTHCVTLKAVTVSGSDNQWDCDQCAPGYYPNVYSLAIPDSTQSTCTAVADANGCLAMPSGAITSTDFKCTSCKLETFYLEDVTALCKYRTVIPKCILYRPEKDECQTCEFGSFLSSSHLACVEDPKGVPYCVVPSPDLEGCVQCDSDYRLANDLKGCVLLAVEDKKTHCVAYGMTKQCIACGDTYFLTISGECKVIEVANCLELKDENCANMKYLNPDTSAATRDCLQLTIANCLRNTEQKCLQCDPTTKLAADALSCTAKTKSLPNCTAYSSEEKCTRCTPPFILDVKEGICTMDQALGEYLDPNCAATSLTPKCNVCDPGHYFNTEGICVNCTAEFCLFCTRGGTECAMCVTGYFMTSSGVCQQNKAVLFDSFEVTDLKTEGGVRWVMGWCWVVLLWVLTRG